MAYNVESMKTGKLYVIGTPIGNLDDITLRGIETLGKIEVLFCEDSRVSSRLVNSLIKRGLLINKPRYIAYNEFNENRVYAEIVKMVQDGEQVGLVSDAGMPAISDPGYRAIRGCLDESLSVEVIPGPTALTTALPFSGIGGEITIYLGFLPKTKGKAKKILVEADEMMAKLRSVRVVMYVSPHRVAKDLEMVVEVMGDETHCVLMRELTKQYEERVEGSAKELLDKYSKQKPKGEIVLVLEKTRKKKQS